MPFGLTWRTWVGYTIESDAESPYADTPGTGASAPTHFLPLAGAESVQTQKNMLISPTVDGLSMAPNKAAEGSTIVSGDIPSALIPGIFGAAAAGRLYDWGIARSTTSEGEYQLDSATLWIYLADQGAAGYCVAKKIIGAKIARITLDCGEGSGYAGFTLGILGQSESMVTIANPLATALRTDYFGSDCAVPEYRTRDSVTKTGAAHYNWTTPLTDYNVDNMNWSMTIDNKLIEDGHRLDGTGLPRRMYSTGRSVTGSFGKDLRSTTEYARFLAGTEVFFGAAFARGAKSLVIRLPRVIYSGSSPVSDGTKDSYNKESYEFEALSACESPYTLGTELYFAEV